MRRTFAALIVGALGFGIGAPAAAQPAEHPADHPAPQRLKLACSAVPDGSAHGSSPEDSPLTTHPEVHPAVHCEWSPAPARDAAGAPAGYRLRRGGWWGRLVVYRGPDTQATDEHVRPCRAYRYKVHAVGPEGGILGASDVVRVKMPCRVRPVPRPVPDPLPLPGPEPDPRPIPAPEPKPVPEPDPRPIPAPEPKPVPVPEPKPAPVPEPKPAPVPEPRPAPGLDLACHATAGHASGPGDDRMMRPTIWEPPAVACTWALRSSSDTSVGRIAGFRLWKASRNADNHIVFRTHDQTSYLDHDVVSGGTYGYLVQAVDAAGNVVAGSAMVKVAVPGSTDPAPEPRPLDTKPVEG